MFQINVWDLLASYSGDSRELEFSGEVIPGYYEDIVFTESLSFKIKLVSLDDGVEVIFEYLDTKVVIDENPYTIHIENVSRTFKESFDPLLSDDIKFVGKGTSIDLKDVLREEILISIY